ncbi:hypothetical protein JG688_00016910 [Phytophthora aleatoria]|uniref:Uncharacterized protein n=1 Tax=Phytophthora aleatoria TaxID=2496075 RepID=A0A8J5IRC4_9STRA|nr:hypothetical protein JG688_00016910 [Phytophthora aleatoria]
MGPNASFAEDGERLVGRLPRVREYQYPSRRSISRSYPDCFGGSLKQGYTQVATRSHLVTWRVLERWCKTH